MTVPAPINIVEASSTPTSISLSWIMPDSVSVRYPILGINAIGKASLTYPTVSPTTLSQLNQLQTTLTTAQSLLTQILAAL